MDIQLIGFGVIGQGFARVLEWKRGELEARMGQKIRVVSITDITGTAYKEEGLDLKKVLEQVESTGKVIDYPGAKDLSGVYAIEEIPADLVLEVTPSNIKTGQPGLDHMLTAMEEGKHVVTSNKAPLVLEFRTLVEKAEKKGVEFKYEATVGGAMPIINLARETLSGDRVISIEGILNGTTNYILTRMAQEGEEFEQVLREAQNMGYAETDPTYDVEGIDTASKLVILANALMGMNASYGDVSLKGITRITPEAVALAGQGDYAIKLIGEVKNGNLEVAPRLVPQSHPLNVGGALNVAMLDCDIAGEVTVVGKGAGARETNSAILSDIISIGRG